MKLCVLLNRVNKFSFLLKLNLFQKVISYAHGILETAQT